MKKEMKAFNFNKFYDQAKDYKINIENITIDAISLIDELTYANAINGNVIENTDIKVIEQAIGILGSYGEGKFNSYWNGSMDVKELKVDMDSLCHTEVFKEMITGRKNKKKAKKEDLF